jgi:hypothetical protein
MQKPVAPFGVTGFKLRKQDFRGRVPVSIDQSRRFYSPILLFKAYVTDLTLCDSRRDLGPPPSAMRPWVPGSARSTDRRRLAHGRPRTGPRTRAGKATDGAGGSGYADRFHLNSRPDLAFQLVAGIPEFSHRVAAAWRRS